MDLHFLTTLENFKVLVEFMRTNSKLENVVIPAYIITAITNNPVYKGMLKELIDLKKINIYSDVDGFLILKNAYTKS
jgi:hypothetical protein